MYSFTSCKVKYLVYHHYSNIVILQIDSDFYSISAGHLNFIHILFLLIYFISPIINQLIIIIEFNNSIIYL